jgi:hypothetical protein
MLQAHIHAEYHSDCGQSSPRTVGPQPNRGSAGVALHELAKVYDERCKVPQPFAADAAVLRLSAKSLLKAYFEQ